MLLELEIDGIFHKIEVEPTKRLLDILRDDFKILSIKEGCGEGECGACSVLVDDKIATSCIVSASAVHKKRITTLTGIKKTELFKYIEDGFANFFASQCGFCTPAMVVAAYSALINLKDYNIEEKELPYYFKKSLEGNLCRCTGYNQIVDALIYIYKNLMEKNSIS